VTRARVAAIAVFGLLLAGEAHADEKDALPETNHDRGGFWLPDYARVQTGGFVGMLTFGVGYSALNDFVNVSGSYGWVPPQHGNPAAHLGTLTAALRPLRFSLSKNLELYPIYAGGGLFIGHNARHRPEVVEDSPTVYWGMLLFGAELALRDRPSEPILRHSLFVEEVTLGPYLDAVVKNGGMHLTSAFSTAIGYRASF